MSDETLLAIDVDTEHRGRRPQRPRFFSGQLLTDDDLKTLVDWTVDRFERAAQRDGIGVVDGLGLELDPGDPLGVRVTPGVAIDAYGQEIVVAETKNVRLSLDDIAAAGKVDPGEVREEFAGLRARPHRARPFLLTIRYDDRDVAPRSRLAHDDDGDQGFDMSRTEEDSVLELQLDRGTTESDTDAERWKDEFDACARVVTEFKESFQDITGHGPEVRDWLHHWIQKEPLHEFSFVRQLLADAECAFDDEATCARMLFYIVQDARLALMSRVVASTEEEPDDGGVVLGRVWVAEPVDDPAGAHILGVDPDPGLRGGALAERRPAPLGQVHLADVLWAPGEDAIRMLAERGLRMAYEEPLGWPTNLAWLDGWLDQKPFVSPWGEVVVQTLDAGQFGRRIVGFRTTGAGRREGLRLDKRAVPERAVPGQEIEYVFTLHNTGRTPLTVRIADDDVGDIAQEGAEDISLLPRQTRELRRSFDLPLTSEVGPRRSGARAHVSGAGGEAFEREAECTVEVLDARDTQFETDTTVGMNPLTGRVHYHVRFVNRGRLPLQVALTWGLEGLDESKVVDEAASEPNSEAPVDFRRVARLGRRRAAHLSLVGTTADGRRVAKRDTHRLSAAFSYVPWLAVALFLTAAFWAASELDTSDARLTTQVIAGALSLVYLIWRFRQPKEVWRS